MKYPIIKQLSGKFPVRRLCKMLEVSHGGYYEWRGRGPSPRAREDRRLRVQIRAAFRESRDRYGSPRIHKQLRQRGIRCSRKRVARLMRQEGLRARQPRRFRVTTRPTPGRSAAPNVLARRFTVDAVDSVWVGDLTYLWTQEGWLYLAVLMDLCSRRIIGWAVSETMTDDLTLAVLDQALEQRRPGSGVLHHSDRGSQYSSDDYLDKLRDRGFTISMSRKGDCWDNAPMESFFSTLKFQLGGCFSSRAAARAELFHYIEVFYHRARMHTSIGDQSPAQFEAAMRRPGQSGQSAVEADAPVEIDSRFPPSLGQRSALPTAPTAANTTTTMDLN